MNTAIAVFCKTPGLSPIKTRLSADIGDKAAEEFYRLSVAAIEEILRSVKGQLGKDVEVYWALAEKEALEYPIWSTFPKLWTGVGGLGDRIHHVFQELSAAHEQVIIIGSDSPQITMKYLVEAIDGLSGEGCDGIIGPCSDGGFVLFGCKKPISKSIWTNVAYSQADTLEQLKIKLDKENYIYKIIQTLGDIDEYDDLIQLLRDYSHMGAMISIKQAHLYQWLQRLLISKAFLGEAAYYN